ncbi:hypothetical protein CHS0354_016958 [Potamilus streckersoni]|uniref:MAM domain-containing protein n=1 Tax=Potamilus streckersoni TaxID=2493646 RepID=A0AAE0VQF5_9BIVA|nr:hypothetical protein CHS0354_016958 [Potamilus streckersoni]
MQKTKEKQKRKQLSNNNTADIKTEYMKGISFTYEVHRAAKVKFGLTIGYNGVEENLFSTAAEYDGIFRECVVLLSHENQKLELVFYVTKGQSLDGNIMNIKLLDVLVQQTACKNEMCTFESLSSCNFTVGCSDQNGYQFKLSTGSGFSPFTGPSADFTFKNSTGHYMLADASSGAMGDSASFYTYSDVKATNALFLRFYYYMNGPNVGSLEVFLKLSESNEETICQTLRGNYLPSWYMACTVLNISVSGRYEMQFKAVRGNGTQGDLAIDDTTVTTTPCPHPASCGFEEPNNCEYAMMPSAYYWTLTPSYSLNAGRHSNGYHMQTVSNSSVESDIAVIQSPPFELTRNTKCALFEFYMAGDDVGSLTVTVSYDNGTKTKKSFYVAGDQGDEWFRAKISLAYMDYNNVSIIFSAMRGQIGSDVIALDNIVISEKVCTNGIQEEVCEFDSPFTCGYQSNFSDGSEYQWTRRIGPSLTNGTGPQFDANGDPYGAYLTVDSSYGTEHQYSFVWFPAIVTSSTSKLTFYNHMYGRDNQVADLSVLFATDAGLHVLAEFCCNNGETLKFKCLDLPYTLHGVLYFKAVRKNGVFGDVAIDKIGLLEGNCTDYVMRSEGTASLISPPTTLNRSSCISFDYQLMAKDSTAGLVFVLHYAIASTNVFGKKVLFNATGDQGSMWRKGQIQVDEAEVVSFYIQFLSSGAGRFSVDNIILKTGLCPELTKPHCSSDEFLCLEKCIPSAYECDKKNDCALGEDETRSCSNFLVAYPSYYSSMSLQSPTVNIQINKCLSFEYYSTAILNVTLNPSSPMNWTDSSTHQYWRKGQADVYPGDVTVYFGARRFNTYDQSSVVAIDNIKLLNGTCSEHKPDKCIHIFLINAKM